LHRQKRSRDERQAMLKNVKRLIETLKFNENDEEVKMNESLSKTEKIVEIGKINSEKRKEIEKFLLEMVQFLNELHFICEHSYVLLRDNSLSKDTRDSVSNLVKSFEVVLWRIENNLNFGKGMQAIDELKELFNKGVKCIQMLKNIRVNF